jgi:hypothetical protein
MNKLEELHVTPIRKYGLNLNTSGESAKESAEITTDVAVKFSQWMDDNMQQREYTPMLQMTRKELFDYFINNHYGK